MRQQVPNAVTEGSPAPRGRETVPAIHNEAPTSVGRGGAGNFRSPSKEPGKFFYHNSLMLWSTFLRWAEAPFGSCISPPSRPHCATVAKLRCWRLDVCVSDGLGRRRHWGPFHDRQVFILYLFLFTRESLFLPILTYTIELAFYRTW